MLNTKSLMYACTAIIALVNIAVADFTLPAVPKKLQETWISESGGGLMTIGANTIRFGGPSEKLK